MKYTVPPVMKALEDYVTTIPDFPKEGIMFRDVTTILSDKDGFKLAIDGLIEKLKDVDFDVILGSESRGFVFGAPVAYAMNKGLILVRKKGKLPREVISEDYDLEYGKATLEMHADAIKEGQKVVIIDDLIATGGTTEAVIRLAEREGGKVVKIGFVMELEGLKGRERLKNYDVFSLVKYPGI
jgi:adenine phosphoribosyltransferase